MGDPSGESLLDDERQAWTVLTTVLASLPSALEEPLRRRADLSLFEFQILDTLAGATDRTMRLNALASATNASPSKLSRAVDRLQKRDTVRRTIDDSDGRFTLCRLTDTGERYLAAAVPDHVSQVRRLIFDQLTEDELGHLVAIGSRITDAVRAERDRTPGPTPGPSGPVALSAGRRRRRARWPGGPLLDVPAADAPWTREA